MSAEERLEYHQTHSTPVMDELKAYLEGYRLNHLAEPNGSAGTAINYMLERWDRLTRFNLLNSKAFRWIPIFWNRH